MELTDGVYAFSQTIDRDGQTATFHPAAVETPTGLLLIDAGYADLVDQLAAELAVAGFEWSDVASILITHQDGDHAGALSTVVDQTGATVYAHERCAPYLDGRKEPIKSPDGERYPAATVDVELVDGVTFATEAGPMEVLFTPGHAPGHVALYFPEEALLLAGDALTADEAGLQGPSEQFTLDMDRALESASRLAERAVDRTLCFHGGVVEEGSERIAQVVEAGG